MKRLSEITLREWYRIARPSWPEAVGMLLVMALLIATREDLSLAQSVGIGLLIIVVARVAIIALRVYVGSMSIRDFDAVEQRQAEKRRKRQERAARLRDTELRMQQRWEALSDESRLR